MNKIAGIIAFFLLSMMFAFMIFSSRGDSAIFDEVAHIPAGYTYVKYQDSRLNPEHPPLIKDLAALPLLFLHLNFNTNQEFWNIKNVNDRQWMAGHALLYEFGNNPDQILFWSRLPIMFLALVFGWLLFWWIKKRYGNKVALITLLFYTLSPTFIAHSRFVTTDLAASFGFFLGFISFLHFLEKRTKKSLLIAGLVFGIVQLFKFSLVLLVPIYLILGILWILTKTASNEISGPTVLVKLFGQIILIGLIGLVVIWGVYAFHVWNYPQAQQLTDAKYILGGYKIQTFAYMDFWLINHRLTRSLGQYLYGFLMVAQRTAGGNAAYFKGEISSKGWWSYFPTLMLFKEQLAFYIFGLIALVWALGKIQKQKFSDWVGNNFPAVASLIFILFYLAWSLWSPLNIGVRHALPIFPFLYFLVAVGVVQWLLHGTIPQYLISFLLLLWMALEIFWAFPFYLSYYNILGGGVKQGYRIATDSNYDWGQDLKRLKEWAEHPPTGVDAQKIYLDYFGGGSPEYYLREKFQPWWSARGMPPKGSYLAVSLNSVMGAWARPIGDMVIKPENSYAWLRNKTPLTRAGSSILIYRF